MKSDNLEPVQPWNEAQRDRWEAFLAANEIEPVEPPDGPSGMACAWALAGCAVWVAVGLAAVAVVVWWVRR